MTPDTIAEAVYALGQAADTDIEAQLGGAELGRMLAAQFRAQVTSRERTCSASALKIERTLARLASSQLPSHALVADGALTAWLHKMGAGVER